MIALSVQGYQKGNLQSGKKLQSKITHFDFMENKVKSI